jgi:hypothetical protein
MEQFPKALGAALLNAQGMLRGVGRDGTNPHFKSRYATLENVTETIRPVLQEFGVLFMQAPGNIDEHSVMSLTTWLIHSESGETFSTTIGVPLVKRDPQGVGSAITYACRYSLMALLGLPPVDDDGESAGRAETTTPIKVLASAQAGDLYKALETEIRTSPTVPTLRAWSANESNKKRIAQLPVNFQETLRTEYGDKLAVLQQ